MADYKSCIKTSGVFLIVAALMVLTFTIGAVPDNSILDSSNRRHSENTGESITTPKGTAFSKLNSAAGEDISWQVISGGGDIDGASTNYRLSGTVAQTAAGTGVSDNFELSHGFWQVIGGGEEHLCGDANGDAGLSVGDPVYLINYIFKGGPPPDPLCVGDASGDDTINVGDAVYLINYIFKGGPAPVEPCCP